MDYMCTICIASATISDRMATVTITGLACEQTFSIVAGAIITNNVTMEQMLCGPRLQIGNLASTVCQTILSASAITGKKLLVLLHYTIAKKAFTQ